MRNSRSNDGTLASRKIHFPIRNCIDWIRFEVRIIAKISYRRKSSNCRQEPRQKTGCKFGECASRSKAHTHFRLTTACSLYMTILNVIPGIRPFVAWVSDFDFGSVSNFASGWQLWPRRHSKQAHTRTGADNEMNCSAMNENEVKKRKILRSAKRLELLVV